VDPAVPYGEEDRWIAREGQTLAMGDHVILLFSTGSTPERENHGTFVQAVQAQLGSAAEVTVLLDDESFIRKLRGQASADRRRKERHEAWSAMLADTRLNPISINLADGHDPAAPRNLEKAFMRGTAT
jgi:hypothetical protein